MWLCVCVRECDCVCVCQHFYWILFALQQLRHKSLHHYEFLLPCPIDSHCANLKGARKGMEERERERGKGAVFVCRVLFMCFLHIFPQCKPSGFMEISQMPLARLWPTGRGTLTPTLDALSGNLSDRLLLLGRCRCRCRCRCCCCTCCTLRWLT